MNLYTAMTRADLLNPQIPDMRQRTWMGAGVQTGGAILGGIEHTDGMLFNMKYPSQNAGFKLTNVRLGLRAGFGSTMVALIALNCRTAGQLNGLSCDSTDLALSVGAKWDTLAKSLKEYKVLATLVKLFANGKPTGNLKEIEHLWEGFEKFSHLNEVEESLEDSRPRILI